MDELVLVGGCVVGLLVTDAARTPIRATVDVDLLTQVAPLAAFYKLADQLRELGFAEQATSDVICRWVKGALLIDVMPVEAGVLGFSNAWYAQAAQHAVVHTLPSGRQLQRITAPYFLATKLEAFDDRGGGDYAHRDMEDIVTVVDGCETVVTEVLASPTELRDFLLEAFDRLLADLAFFDRLSWLLPPDNQEARRDITITRMRQIAGL